MTYWLMWLRKQGFEGTLVWGGDGSDRLAYIFIHPRSYSATNQREHYERAFQKNICPGCDLLTNGPQLKCSGVVPGHHRFAESAKITAKEPQSENYWNALFTRLPCKPKRP